MRIDKNAAGGHWMVLDPVKPKSVQRRRRREYERANGILEDGAIIRSTCLEVMCVNPEHVRMGGAQQSRDRIIDEFEILQDAHKVADSLGLTYGYVQATLAEAGLVERRRQMASLGPELLERAEVLLREGVPDRWVAEEVGATRSMIEHLRGRLGIVNDGEWVRVQLSCRHSPDLIALHELFNPPIGIAG